MMRYILFLLFSINILFGSAQILSYNIYERSDRVDVMITFDRPYKGVIKQSTTSSKITLKLIGAQIESIKRKKISSDFLNSIVMIPTNNQTLVEAYVPHAIHVKASRTSDFYGLRLRFTKQASSQNHSQKNQSLSNSLPLKKSDDLSSSYYIVITILILGIIVLYIIKRKFTPKEQQNKRKPNGWGFLQTQNDGEKKDKKQQQTSQNPPLSSSNHDKSVTIRFQKAINDTSSVVMLDFMDQSYLVLMGNNNILLDKFIDNKPTTQTEFENILQERHQQLESFLAQENDSFVLSKENQEALQSYKERAASIAYEIN